MVAFAERVGAQAQDVHVGRALLAFLLGIFWVVGWVAGKLVLALVYAWAAVRLGWIDAREVGRDARR